GEPKFELFDLQNDPHEMNDVSGQNPGVVQEMKTAYDRWFKDVSHTRNNNYDIPLIQIGSSEEPVTLLSRQDWRRSPSYGEPGQTRRQWLLSNPSAGKYQVTMHFPQDLDFRTIILHCNEREYNSSQMTYRRGQRHAIFDGISLPQGKIKLWVSSPQKESDNLAYQVEIKAQ
ncbi:MAG: hypothetical protein MK108_10545, partial [Mariniblastus sp.]|nr:hypothetical protein [Mariniblastus sp.]